MSRVYKRWTEDEERYLIKNSGLMLTASIAKKLNRSIPSVKTKRKKLGIRPFTDQTNLLTITQIGELVGIDRTNVSKIWGKKGLKIKRVRSRCYVREKDLFTFMQKNMDLWMAEKCDETFFGEYGWYLEKLKNEKQGLELGTYYQRRKNWNDWEIRRLELLKKRGLTHKQIAKELDRTKSSIDCKSKRMRIDRN